MTKLTEVLDEASTKLLQLNAPPVNLTGKVVVAYDENDLLGCAEGRPSIPSRGYRLRRHAVHV